MGEILSALSFALDITEGVLPGHSVRTCLIGTRLGKHIGLTDRELSDLYYALLLKDIGCSSNAARMADAFGAEDQVVKRHFKFIDREKLGKPNREALTFVWDNIAPETGTWNRLRQMYRMIRSPGDLTAEMIEARCERGAEILHKFGMPMGTCAAVYTLDEHWNGKGLPDHLVGKDIPLLGRVCAVAQHLDLFCTMFGPEQAIQTLAQRSGSWFDPDLVLAAESLQRQGGLWEQCLPGDSPDTALPAVLALDPTGSTALAARDIDLICSGFADVIDAKSPFTYRHSAATTEVAVLMSRHMGLAPDRVEIVRRAALLHDIGMLSIPNTILDKPGPLASEEWAKVQHHPTVSQKILSRVGVFSEVAVLAEQHHERLDGSGYPLHLHGEQLSIESRLLAVADVFSALLEPRSYRAELGPGEVKERLLAEVPLRLDGDCVDAALSMLIQLAGLPLEDIPGSFEGDVSDIIMVDPPSLSFEALSTRL